MPARKTRANSSLGQRPSTPDRRCSSGCPYEVPMMTVKSYSKSYKVHPREGAFHGKYVRHVLQILIQRDAGSGLLALLDPESRGIKAEIFADLRK